MPDPDDWGVVLGIEPTNRYRILPDGRKMWESRVTVTKAAMEQMWQGYRCAACLEDVRHLGAFPRECPACKFPIRAQQRARLEEDFVEQVEEMRREGWIDRERAYLEERFHVPKTQILRP